MRLFTRTCAALAATAALLAFTPSAGSAAELEGNIWRYKDVMTNKCLDGHQNHIQTYKCDGSAEQQWDVTELAGESEVYVIKNVHTQKCLGHSGATSVALTSCISGNTGQKWRASYLGNSKIQLQNVLGANCLDSNANGDVYTNPCNPGNEYMQWLAHK